MNQNEERGVLRLHRYETEQVEGGRGDEFVVRLKFEFTTEDRVVAVPVRPCEDTSAQFATCTTC